MEIFKDPESGIYHVKFKGTGGKDFTRSTKMTSKAAAVEVVAKARIAEMEKAAIAKALNAESLTAIMAGRKVSCEQAETEWNEWRAKTVAPNTVRTYGLILRQWLRKLGAEKWPVAKVTEDHIMDFVNAIDGTKRSVRQARMHAIRSFTEFCAARGYIVGNPGKNARVSVKGLSHEQKERKQIVPVTEAEFRKLAAGAEGFWRHAVSLSYWTGLRLSDVCCLEWSSIDSTSIVLWTQKTDTRVQVQLREELIGAGELGMTILEMMMESKRGKYCFPEERTTILDPEKRAKLSVYASRLFNRCGIEGKSFHCLRHSFVTRLAKAGKTLEEIGRLVGHASTKTTAGYAH